MSISTTTRKAGPFAGNDVQTVFPFAFKVFTAADVVATRAVAATGVETVLVLTTDYSVTLNPDQDAAPGGSITLATPLATGQVLAITSDIAALQAVTVTNGGGFFPSVFNGVFDRLTILVQQLREQAARTFRIPVTASGVADFNIPVLAGAVLQWNVTGTALIAQTLPDLSLSLALPAQAGHANHALFSNGAAPAWRAPLISDVTGLETCLRFTVAGVNKHEQQMSQINQALLDAQAARAFAINAAVIF